MATDSYFAAKDYDLTLRLQELFLKYADINTQIHNARSSKDGMNEESFELALELKQTVNDIGLLVMEIKSLQADTNIAKNPAHQTLSASKRNNRLQQMGFPS